MGKKEEVYSMLRDQGVPFEVTEHPPVFTMEEMEVEGITLRGTVPKNLFLRDAKGKRHFLVVLRMDKVADLKALQEKIGSTRLSFASPQRLEEHLGLAKGAVSPLGVLLGCDPEVEVIIDGDLKGEERLGVHPCENTATLWLTVEDLLRVVESCGNPVRFVTI